MPDQSVFSTLPDCIQNGLKKVATEQGFTEGLYRVEFEDGSKKGDGFIGELCKVFIRQDGREDLAVMCKTLPNHELRRQFTIGLFHREVAAYNEVLPMIKKFQLEKGLTEGDSEGFWNFPKCYYAYCDMRKMDGVIIMEDLKEKQFRMWDKLEPVNFEHTKLLLKQLGKFHAVSFALKDQQPEVFERFTHFSDPLSQMIEFDPTKGMTKMMNGTCERAIQALDEDDAVSRNKMNTIRGVVTDLYRKDAKAKDAEPYAVLGHGDCWINNMMYCYGEDDKTPSDICLVDWQLCRYGSPILDLMYFVFTSTNEELRAAHYEELMQIYHSSLSDFLKCLGGDAERQFPQSAFQEQLKRFGRFGLLMSFLVLPIICTPYDEIPDIEQQMEKAQLGQQSGEPVEDEKLFSHTKKADAMFRERMRGLVKDVVRFGYL